MANNTTNTTSNDVNSDRVGSRTVRVESPESTNKKLQCHLVSKSETPTRTTLRNQRVVKETLDKFNVKSDGRYNKKNTMRSPESSRKLSKVKREKVSILSLSVKKIKSPKLSPKMKIKMKSNDKSTLDKSDQNEESYIKRTHVSSIVGNFERNLEDYLTKGNAEANENEGIEPKLKNAFKLLMEKGATPQKTPLRKKKLKRCDGKATPRTSSSLMDRWLKK